MNTMVTYVKENIMVQLDDHKHALSMADYLVEYGYDVTEIILHYGTRQCCIMIHTPNYNVGDCEFIEALIENYDCYA